MADGLTFQLLVYERFEKPPEQCTVPQQRFGAASDQGAGESSVAYVQLCAFYQAT